MSDTAMEFASDKLPGGSFARAVFDAQLVQLSDKGSASKLIGDGWSEIVAQELESWVGETIPIRRADLSGGTVEQVHRLDTMPGVAARASSIGFKNPDFLIMVRGGQGTKIAAVDAKFSIETARDEQVSVEATSRLYDDQALRALLPRITSDHGVARGIFASPDYNLTRAMFGRRMGHRRMTVSQSDVVLVNVNGAEMFANIGCTEVIQRLIDLDHLAVTVWDSLLAGQYYFRVSCGIHGCVLEQRTPLLGHIDIPADGVDVLPELDARARKASSAWDLLMSWNREVEHIRRQRKSLHQVVGLPLTGAELRALSDLILEGVELEERPSRNRVRKALGGKFMAEVLDRTGVIMPGEIDFGAELNRVADISRDVAQAYQADIEAIVRGIIADLREPRSVGDSEGAPVSH